MRLQLYVTGKVPVYSVCSQFKHYVGLVNSREGRGGEGREGGWEGGGRGGREGGRGREREGGREGGREREGGRKGGREGGDRGRGGMTVIHNLI